MSMWTEVSCSCLVWIFASRYVPPSWLADCQSRCCEAVLRHDSIPFVRSAACSAIRTHRDPWEQQGPIGCKGRKAYLTTANMTC